MFKEIEYHRVDLVFNVRARELTRAADLDEDVPFEARERREALLRLLIAGLTGNDTNVLDIEDLQAVIDGQIE